jgi:hypothetical protein
VKGLFQLSFQNIWRLVKIIVLIQVFNVALSCFMWLSYGHLVSGWTIAALSVSDTFLILATKNALENVAKAELTK